MQSQRTISPFLAAIALALAIPGGEAFAQSRLEGRWGGEAITDAFRGMMTLTISTADGAQTVYLTMTVGDRKSEGAGKIVVLDSDSIRFTSTVGGAETTYQGALKGDSLVGSLEARRDGEVLGRGRWVLTHSKETTTTAVPPSPSTSRAGIFEEAWKLVDTRYGNFPSKGIDWAMIRRIYHDRAAAVASDGELAATLAAMLGHLNDNHITLRANDSLYRPNGNIDRSSFVEDSVVAKFLVSPLRRSAGGWIYAWTSDSAGYLRIDEFHNARNTRAQIDSILNTFRTAKGIVIDLRRHFGGDDFAAKEVIDRFATSRGLYLTSRAKGGDAHNDFLEPRSFYYEPKGQWQFTKPVMILTSRRTVSAGENFLLGMRELPQVTVIGDVTSGAFADVGHFKLSNGWEMNFPFNRFVDKNGLSWEGVGLAPDIKLVARPSDISAGRDIVLEFALKALKAASVRD